MPNRRDFLIGALALSIGASSARAQTLTDEAILFAESENRFFMRSVDAQGTFLRSTDGEVRQLIWHQNGKYQYCPRVY
jgi:hypothetical protein